MRYLMKAKEIAMKSDYKRAHVGCVAVYQGHIIGSASNANKTHPIQKKYNIHRVSNNIDLQVIEPKVHAEIACLCSINDIDKSIKWNRVKLYIYRPCIIKEYGMARPCSACMDAIKSKGIRDIYYTTNDGIAYERLEYNE